MKNKLLMFSVVAVIASFFAGLGVDLGIFAMIMPGVAGAILGALGFIISSMDDNPEDNNY
jgi:hypothetical protein